MSKRLKKALVILLSFAMILTCFPMSVFADEEATGPDYHYYVAMGTSITGGYGMGGSGWGGVGIAGSFGNDVYPRLVKDHFGIENSYDGALLGTRAHEFRVLLEDDFHGDEFTEGWSQVKCQNGEANLKRKTSAYKAELAKADIISFEIGSNELLSVLIFEMTDYLEELEGITLGGGNSEQGLISSASDVLSYAEMALFMTTTLERSMASFQENFDAVLRDIREINPTADIYIISTYNPIRFLLEHNITNNDNGSDTIKQMVLQLGKMAGMSDATTISAMETLTNTYVTRENNFLKYESDYADDYTYVDVTGIDLTGSADGTHPSVAGHAYIAERLENAIMSKYPCQHRHLLVNGSSVPASGRNGATGSVVCADCGTVLQDSQSINSSYIAGDGEVPVSYSEIAGEPILFPGLTPDKNDTVIGFTSDVHNKTGNVAATRLGNWLSTTKKALGKLDFFAMCGDYANGDGSANGDAYWNLASSVFDELDKSGVKYSATTGNHEQSNGNFATTTNSVAKKITRTGEVQSASNYKVYALGANTQNNAYDQADIDALTSYLEKVGKDLPVFITAHFPLHDINGRTIANKDKVIELLNNYPNVIFVWGHNHTEANSSETHYDKIYTGSIDNKPIKFTYLSAGCMSDSENNAGSAAVTAKGLVAIVSNDKVPQVTLAYLNENSSMFGIPTQVDITGVPELEVNSIKGSYAFEQSQNITAGKQYIIAYNGVALDLTNCYGYINVNDYSYSGFKGKAVSIENNKVTGNAREDMVWKFEQTSGGYYIKNVVTGKYLNATYVGSNPATGTLMANSTKDVWSYSGGNFTSSNAGKKLAFDLIEDVDTSIQGEVDFFTVRSKGDQFTFYEVPEGTVVEKAPEAVKLTNFGATTDLLEDMYVVIAYGNRALSTSKNNGYSVTTNNGWYSQTTTFKGLNGKTITFDGMNKISKDGITKDMIWKVESAGNKQYTIKNLLTGEYLNATYSGGGNNYFGGGSESGTLKLDNTKDTWTYTGSGFTSKNASNKLLTFATEASAGEGYDGSVNFFTVKSSGQGLTLYYVEKPEELPNPTYADMLGSCVETQYVELGEGIFNIVINGSAIGVEDKELVTTAISKKDDIALLDDCYKWEISKGENGGWLLKNLLSEKYVGAYIVTQSSGRGSSGLIGSILSSLGSMLGITSETKIVSASITDQPYEWYFDNGFYTTVEQKSGIRTQEVPYYLVCLGDYLAISDTIVGNLTKTYTEFAGGTHDFVVTDLENGKVNCRCKICGKVYEGVILETGGEIIDLVLGDLNGDEQVTEEDAIYLLYHYYRPNDYKVDQNVDYDNDGKVTEDDAIYLLYHVYRPQQYPLKAN